MYHQEITLRLYIHAYIHISCGELIHLNAIYSTTRTYIHHWVSISNRLLEPSIPIVILALYIPFDIISFYNSIHRLYTNCDTCFISEFFRKQNLRYMWNILFDVKSQSNDFTFCTILYKKKEKEIYRSKIYTLNNTASSETTWSTRGFSCSFFFFSTTICNEQRTVPWYILYSFSCNFSDILDLSIEKYITWGKKFWIFLVLLTSSSCVYSHPFFFWTNARNFVPIFFLFSCLSSLGFFFKFF